MELKSKRDEIVELVNKLFIYTDSRQWDKLQREVFKDVVFFDMASVGAGQARELSASAICDMWEKGFEGIDEVHHQSGNFIINFNDDVDTTEASVLCYAIAIHFKKDTLQGKKREFAGSYDIHTIFTDRGWRIDALKYNLRYLSGFSELA